MTLSVRKASGWTVSWLFVLAVHVGIGLWALYWHPEAIPVEMPPAAMMIELPPLPEPVAPPPAPAQIIEPEPEPVPDVVEAPKPELVLEKPEPKPKPKPKVKPVEPPKPIEKPAPEPQETTQPAPPAPPTPQAPPAAPVSAGKPSMEDDEKANWLGKIKAHMDAKMHYPTGEPRNRVGAVYNVKVTFTVDKRGKIVDVTVDQTNARASFNRDVLRQIRRASPLPPPPESMLKSGEVPVSYPLNFNLKD